MARTRGYQAEAEVIENGHCCGCHHERRLHRVAPSRYRCDDCIKHGDMSEREKTVPCELCGEETRMTGTKRCDSCYELETRIQANPELAVLILERLDVEQTILEDGTRELVKKRAYEIDPECWISYSGKSRFFKRHMDRRRTAAIRQASKEFKRWV